MNKRLIGLAEQLLFASAVFVVVLLLFNDRIVLPVWLQAVGRMHPLLLHFPIVILLLAVGADLLRSKDVATNTVYRTIAGSLLLVGALSAGVTVIMGLFLAREDGYAGSVLQWHKWLGVAVFGLTCLLYWARKQTWYRLRVAQVGALTTALALTGAGHYGATLTHGDNFVLEPITRNEKAEPVPLDQALLFADVIQPIFEQKCVSCHNPDKEKGELSLTTTETIQKGGKSGRLYVAGNPAVSLLLQRIHLPTDEKKHMPPAGKAQLTPQEMMLLALWVKDRASFTKKVVDLPAKDSLRFVASTLFKPAQAEETFAFTSADPETVTKLNNDYRTVAPLARESPALAVNLYNKSTYGPEKLRELEAVKQQVVSLNLNKLPVTDADLKIISQFENLRHLDLNFTDVTGSGLKDLTTLNQLESLALSGTGIRYDALRQQIGAFKHLKTLAIWNTKLTDAQIQELRKANGAVTFVTGFDGNKSVPITLNPPQLKNPSPIFSQSMQVQLKHPIKGVEIRYTTDGTDPDSIHSPVFTDKTVITQSQSIRARAYKPGWYGSSVATFDLYRSAYRPDSANLLMPLNPVHQADGANTFFDHKLGTFNANSPAWANNWAGVRKNDLVLVSEFRKPVSVQSVSLRTMIEPETGIFPPAVIEVWGGNSRDNMHLIATARPALPAPKSEHVLTALGCTFKPQTVSYLKIVAKPQSSLPDWHPSKGKPGLLLVDEVFIN